MVLLLIETPAGYGLFKPENHKLLKMDPADLAEMFTSPKKAAGAISVKSFHMFKDLKEAHAETVKLIDSKMGKSLKTFLKDSVPADEALGVSEKALGSYIKKKLGLSIQHDKSVIAAIKGIRSQLEELVVGLSEKQSHAMAVSLAHSVNRFKLKFSPEKVDTMVIQAAGLLDDLDKELNNFAMRLREWYGWHFPELTKLVPEMGTYAKVIKAVGYRKNFSHIDAETLLLCGLDDNTIESMRQASEVSIGTDITADDLARIKNLAERVVDLEQYRGELSEYLRVRMTAIAPNLTYMVGELVGARLLAHAGSLINLAKHPASTIQILGAEKALFRAMKAHAPTPKYGLLYHAQLVGAAANKFKGRITRTAAAKVALCVRVDALGDQKGPTVAVGCKRHVEKRLQQLANETSPFSAQANAQEANRAMQYTPKRLRTQ